MRGAPADMGDWSLVRLFYEGGRLLRKHFGDFLPIMLVFIFPVCLTRVYYTQFYLVDFFRPRGPTDPEPTPLLTLRLLQIPLDLVSVLLFVCGVLVISQVVKDKIYVGDDKTERQSESFYTNLKLAFTSATGVYTTVKLAFTTTKVETETSAKLAFATTKIETETSAKLPLTTTKVEREASAFKTHKAKVLKSFGTLGVYNILFVGIPTTEIKFTPEAIAATGLPPWTIFLFTLLMALYTTLATSYFQLMCVLVGSWLLSPQTPLSEV